MSRDTNKQEQNATWMYCTLINRNQNEILVVINAKVSGIISSRRRFLTPVCHTTIPTTKTAKTIPQISVIPILCSNKIKLENMKSEI